MAAFVAAVVFTLGISALCSVLEAMILSTTTSEIEDLKNRKPRPGLLLERLRDDLDTTISSILTLNTVANTLGAILVGGLAIKLFGEFWLGIVSATMTLAILFFSEILPKNIGVIYRRKLQPTMVYPLLAMCRIAYPLTVGATWVVRRLLRASDERVSGAEIVLLAEKGAREGTLGAPELKIIQSSLLLEETQVQEIMTPRNVVAMCEETETAGEVLTRFRTIPFARLPVYEGTFDNITGIVRRRDILQAVAKGRGHQPLKEMRNPTIFIPEVGRLRQAMEKLITEHQQLGVVIDEFGSYVGVVTLEDIFEFLIGREFYERDDMAVDMQELARKRSALPDKKKSA